MEEYKNKLRYKDFLIDLVEKKVKMKRMGMRQKYIDNLRKDDNDVPFEGRKQRIEK